MNINELLTAIDMPKNKYSMQQAGALLKIYAFLKSNKKEIISSKIIATGNELYFGRHEEESRWNKNIMDVIQEGQKMKFDKFQVTTKTGNYNFAIPIDNEFYYSVCSLLDISYIKAEKETIAALKTISIDSDILAAIKKAAKFVSKDGLRPAMMGVNLNFENDMCEVVGTNAHYMFISKKLGCNSGKDQFNIIISPESCKIIAALKCDCLNSILDILPDQKIKVDNRTITLKKAVLDGKEIDLIDARFPDYKVVIPDHETKMEFNRVVMIQGIKSVIKQANQVTNQINFHLNGKIEMNTQDIDFSFEGSCSMPYISKNFEDTNTSFNGKFLLESLNIFTDKTLSMYHSGGEKNFAVFSNESDRVLLVPLTLND